jgi:hypothetical protein
MEHGRVGHTQLYPETLHVPLLVLHPDRRQERRVSDLVQSIDIAPTLFELAGLSLPATVAGQSLVSLIAGDSRPRSRAYAEVIDEFRQESLIEGRRAELLQLIETTYRDEGGGTWITRGAELDWPSPVLEFSLASFHRPRPLEITVDGETVATIEVGTRWSRRRVELPADRRAPYRIGLATPGCDSPKALGLSDDGRCLSIKVRGIELRRSELFDLGVDRLAQRDLSRATPELRAELAARLDESSWSPVAQPLDEGLAEDEREALRALGYIQ